MEFTRREFLKVSNASLLTFLSSSYLFAHNQVRSNPQSDFEFGDLIYSNSFTTDSDIDKFRLEGDAIISFPGNCMRMENRL